MKETMTVKLDAIKHERDKDGYAFTTLHLELPSGTDLKFLQKAHRLTKKTEKREEVNFTLIVYAQGDRRKWPLRSKGSKTKDYKVVAVVERLFNAHDRAELLFDPADPRAVELTFEVEIIEPPRPLFPPQDDDKDEGRLSA
ncbi:hypothetical protein SAMN04488058_101327 [Deinococcus reticulitermitis]|uniref:Uncharacterized protein n=1 Tax=Deinococcus reticulitermitis TaxID=856736 RepID=A0A1H6SJT2_9DEIO|nr:hypothetical protein [Deinococcus reticulitermitis]SEI68133.1 hypothetical protein SAMN04488058_101327 [Deinococcus reticulitermitis]